MKSSEQNADVGPRNTDLNGVCALIPHGLFIMASAFEDLSSGILVPWVQCCSDDPLMVMVSIRRGHPVEPLIRDSRAFTLSQISNEDRYLIRKFSCDDARGELCEGISTRHSALGSPIIDRAMSMLDCELVRNVELDPHFRLYVGQVRHSELLNPGTPAVCLHDRSAHQNEIDDSESA
jgi:flavin reductase (DIM6/NTAB) family NADH-FMN oxidoreductase RutF